MQQYKNRYRARDTVLLSGWLFADLLLGLMMIFFVAVPRFVPPPVIPPVLTVNPTNLDPTNTHCTGGTSSPQCTITVTETTSSPRGNMTWTASSDMSDMNNMVQFSPASGTLSPGKSMTVTIARFLCQNGSFTFSGSRGTIPVTILWKCTPPPLPQERLELNPYPFTLTNIDVTGLLSNPSSTQVVQSIKTQVINQINQQKLQGRRAGLVIAYGGTGNPPDTGQGQTIAKQVYTILQQLAQGPAGDAFHVAFQNAVYYTGFDRQNLFTLYGDPSTVMMDIYFFA